MGCFLKHLRDGFLRVIAPFAPKCFVLVIFGDGSFLVARLSRLEAAREEIALDGDAGRCQLRANLGGLRIYRHVRDLRLGYQSDGTGKQLVQ